MISEEAKKAGVKLAHEVFLKRARRKGLRGLHTMDQARIPEGELAELLGRSYDAGRESGAIELANYALGAAKVIEQVDGPSMPHLPCPDPKRCAAGGKCGVSREEDAQE